MKITMHYNGECRWLPAPQKRRLAFAEADEAAQKAADTEVLRTIYILKTP